MPNQIFLRITCNKTGNTKTLEFDDELRVSEIYEKLNEKFGVNEDEKYMLYRPLKKFYLSPGRTLYSYEFANEETLIYRNPVRMMKIKLMDNTTKLFSVNDSEPISNILDMVLDKLKINCDSKDEYGFLKDEPELDTKKKSDKNAPRYSCLASTNVKWLDTSKTLCFEDIEASDILILKKKLFYTDERLNRHDKVQINLIYNQVKETIINGINPCTLEEAVLLAAIQCQIQYGDCDLEKVKSSNIIIPDECMPPEYRKTKKVEKLISDEYMKLKGLTDLDGKFKYVQMCKSLKTYGTTFFLVKEKNSKKKSKLVTVLLGVTKSSVIRLNPETKEVMDEWKFKTLKRWNFNSTSFTIDFGENKDTNYVVETEQGSEIAKLINDYILLALKMKNKNEKKEDEAQETEEFAQVVEEGPSTAVQNTVNVTNRVEVEVKKINVNDYLDILNNALMYLGNAEECIIKSGSDNIFLDKTYYQNFKTISADIDTTNDNIKKLGPLSKDEDLEGICNKVLNVASTLEEITTLVVFNSYYLINNNLTKNLKVKEKESSLLIKNYYFKGGKDLKTSSLYSIPDTASVCSSVKSRDSFPRDDSSIRSFDSKITDIRNITNTENYKSIADKIFLPETYKVVMHTKYIVESLKETFVTSNDSQRYTLLSIDTRIIIELLNKLKINIYENVPGKSDCNNFIKRISEVKKNFTQLQESITNETISIENNDDEESSGNQFEERYLDILNNLEKNTNGVFDLSKENYIIMIPSLRQLQEQFNEIYPYSYKVCVKEYKDMTASTYLKKFMLFLNLLSLYVNDIKKMYGDYKNLEVEDCESYDNAFSELQSLIDMLRLIPKKEVKEEKKEVEETLNFYNDVLTDSDLARLNKLIEILNNCPNLANITPNEKSGSELKSDIMKVQTLGNFMIIMCNCINEIYKFYYNLEVPTSTDENEENDNNGECEVDYDKKDKVILLDVLENLTFKFSDVTIELCDVVNNVEFKHNSGNLFDNEADLYLEEIKKDLLQVMENEKKIINNEDKNKNIWSNNIEQVEQIQSVMFNLLSHLPLSDNERNSVIYIIYKLKSIIQDLDEQIILSDSTYINSFFKTNEFVSLHQDRIKREYDSLCKTFNDLVESKLTEKGTLALIVKTIHIFELYVIMLKLSVSLMTCLSKEKQKEIFETAKTAALTLNNIVVDKLGLTEDDILEINVYMEDSIDLNKFNDKINISENINEELVTEFNDNMKDLEVKMNSTFDTKSIMIYNVNSLYQNINDIIEDVKTEDYPKYTSDIGDFENVCNAFIQKVNDISTDISDYDDQRKIYKLFQFYFAFKTFSYKLKTINTENDSNIVEAKKEILSIYNTIAPINIKLKVDIISLLDEGKEVENSKWESILKDVSNISTQIQGLSKKAKEAQVTLYTSPKIQRLNNFEKYFDCIFRNNLKELSILSKKEFYNGNTDNLVFYLVTNALSSVHVFFFSLMRKCYELFKLSCNSPMENQMYIFDDNWCDLIINSFTEINDSIKNASNVIHKNTSYIKNINMYEALKKLYESVHETNYLASKKYILDDNNELWTMTAGENALRSIEIAMAFMEVDNTVPTIKLNMNFVYIFFASVIFYIFYSLFY